MGSLVRSTFHQEAICVDNFQGNFRFAVQKCYGLVFYDSFRLFLDTPAESCRCVLTLDMQNEETLFSKAHMQSLLQNENYL
mgnify:FL=1